MSRNGALVPTAGPTNALIETLKGSAQGASHQRSTHIMSMPGTRRSLAFSSVREAHVVNNVKTACSERCLVDSSSTVCSHHR